MVKVLQLKVHKSLSTDNLLEFKMLTLGEYNPNDLIKIVSADGKKKTIRLCTAQEFLNKSLCLKTLKTLHM